MRKKKNKGGEKNFMHWICDYVGDEACRGVPTPSPPSLVTIWPPHTARSYSYISSCFFFSLLVFSIFDFRFSLCFLPFLCYSGDVLFVPAGCPHHVENLTDTLALSCNYVDATNVDNALVALGHQASLLRLLFSVQFLTSVSAGTQVNKPMFLD